MKLFSVIIPFKKKTKYLDKNLSEFNKIKFESFEIILLPDYVFKLDYNYKFDIKVIPTGPLSPPQKRDIGVNKCQSKYIFFIDDDAYPSIDIFEKTLLVFENHKNVSAVAGPAVDPPDENKFGIISSTFFNSKFGGGFPERYSKNNKVFEVYDWPTVNLFIRRRDFEKIRGFNTKIWPGEDSVFCEKLLKHNMKILYSGHLFVYHYRRTSWQKHFKQVSNYGYQRGFFCKKYFNDFTKIKYFVPTLFLFSNLLGFINIFLFNKYLWVFNCFFLIYLFTVFSISLINKKNFFQIFYLFLVSHTLYGLNFLIGFFSSKARYIK